MQMFIFVLFFLAAIYTSYEGLRNNNLFFIILGIGFNLGLFGGLLIDGIHFLVQINSTGHLIYAAQTGANNPFVQGLAWFFFSLGILNMYHFYRSLEMNGWKLRIG